MRSNSLQLTLVLFCTALGSLAAPQDQTHDNRLNALMIALRSEHVDLRSRAAEELFVDYAADSNVLARAILAFASPMNVDAQKGPMLTLHSTGKPALPTLIQCYPAARDNASIAMCIGRYGEEARLAIPVLCNQLERLGVSPSSKATLRVILANIGYTNRANLEAITASLKDDQLVAGDTMLAMGLVQAHSWLTEDIKSAITRAIESNSTSRFPAVLAFSAFGERAEGAPALLEKAERSQGSDDRAFELVAQFARAKVDRQNRQKLLQDVLQRLADSSAYEPTAIALFGIAWAMLDDEMLGLISNHTCDTNQLVQLGALRILEVIGMRGRKATESVLSVAKDSGNEKTRSECFRVLGQTLPYARAGALEVCLESERSQSVRFAIEHARCLIALNLYAATNAPAKPSN